MLDTIVEHPNHPPGPPCEEKLRVRLNGHLHTQTTNTYCVLGRPRPARKSK